MNKNNKIRIIQTISMLLIMLTLVFVIMDFDITKLFIFRIWEVIISIINLIVLVVASIKNK
ncbi:MAG: hypothetical protein A2Y17_01505 [Clostridiales bacterium GWF2_38_85]|nr:MAG: hypothetical protein A2Y17_01505 [Clostridiales bacterium GWF2_38_85]HBL84815.1 hypothetical protein [Clostridiales bacterium]